MGRICASEQNWALLFRRPVLIPRRISDARLSHVFPRQSLKPCRQFRQYSSSKHQERLNRLQERLPRFLHPYTRPILSAPVSHISAFLILHELTAIVPLLGLVGLFHYTNWLPSYFAEGKWVKEGVEKIGRWFRRKGWLREDEFGELEGATSEDGEITLGWKDRWWGRGEGGIRLVVEFATAYAITKALLPIRLILSAWATPWFARWTVIPLMNGIKSIFGRK